MEFIDALKSGITTAFDTVSDVTQNIIEKNRTNAQLAKLRNIMKNECEMINRAYISLGKQYYESKQNDKCEPCENEEELFKVIEDSKTRIKKARERYRQILECQTVEIVNKYDIGDLEDITVACSNEDEYEQSPFNIDDEAQAPVAEDIVLDESEPGDEEVAQDDDF